MVYIGCNNPLERSLKKRRHTIKGKVLSYVHGRHRLFAQTLHTAAVFSRVECSTVLSPLDKKTLRGIWLQCQVSCCFDNENFCKGPDPAGAVYSCLSSRVILSSALLAACAAEDVCAAFLMVRKSLKCFKNHKQRSGQKQV